MCVCVCDWGRVVKECLEMEEGQGWIQLVSFSLKGYKGSGNWGEVRKNKLGSSNYRMPILEHLRDHLI